MEGEFFPQISTFDGISNGWWDCNNWKYFNATMKILIESDENVY